MFLFIDILFVTIRNQCQSYKSVFEKNSVAKRTRIYRIDTDTSLVGRYCLPDSRPFVLYNPESSSRVTLAALGIVFQTKLVDTDTVIYYIKPITLKPFFIIFLVFIY